MWSNTSGSKVTSGVVLVGAAIFNTHMNVDIYSKQYDVFHEQITSNFDNGRWVSVKPTEDVGSESSPLVSVSEIITYIKTSLGLPNKDIALIFSITRQTLHSYANGADAMQNINPYTRKRMFTLFEVVKEIAPKFIHSPGAMAKNYTVDGQSLLELLTERELNLQKIVKVGNKIADKMSNTPPSSSSDDKTLYTLTRSV